MPYVGCTGDPMDDDYPDHEQCSPGDDTPNGEKWGCDQGDPPWVCPVGIQHFGYTQDDIVMLIAADTEREVPDDDH